jgi:hypothetical protein
MRELIRLLEACEVIIARSAKKDSGAKYCLEQIKKVLNEHRVKDNTPS